MTLAPTQLDPGMDRATAEGWAEWVRTDSDRRAVAAGCWFDVAAAEHVREFFRRFLRHTTGKWNGKRFELMEVQWREIIGPLFGWKTAEGKRRYKSAFIAVPKKTLGKSTLMSGLILYLLIGDREPSAEIYAAATSREQASIIFRECAKMVGKSKPLSERLDVVTHSRTILDPATGSYFRVLPHDARTVEGLNAHAIVIDELHAHANRELFDSLRWAGSAREQPLFICITTAGVKQESICGEQWDYARKVIAGTIVNDAHLAVVYESGPEDDWTAPETWRKANPTLGITVSEADFARECQEAQDSPTLENSFRRYRLNQWVGADSAWLSMERWAACVDPDRHPDDLLGLPCIAALDLSSTQDFTALVMLFQREDRYDVLARFWIPKATAHLREKRDKIPVLTWARQGYLTLTDGNAVDFDFVERDIKALAKQYSITELAFDRWAATPIVNHLQADGMNLVAFGQGFQSMSPASKELERIVLSGRLNHFNNPVLKWMASNVIVERDAAENVKPSKAKSTDRIDGIVSLIMALGRATAVDTNMPSMLTTAPDVFFLD